MQLLGRKPIGKTRCPESRALLPSYVEGELRPEDRERVAGHLQICSACRAEEKQFRASLGALAASEHVSAPSDLYAGFSTRLYAAENAFRVRAMRMRFAGAAACLLLVTAVGAKPLLIRYFAPAPEEDGIVKIVPEPSAVITFKHDRKVAARKASGAGRIAVKDDSSIVTPAPPVAEPRKPSIRRKPDVSGPPPLDFLDIQPKEGLSAREQIASGEARGTSVGSDAVPVRPDRSVNSFDNPGFIAERNERIQVGDTVTTVKTGYQLDVEGRRKVVNINIGTAVVP